MEVAVTRVNTMIIKHTPHTHYLKINSIIKKVIVPMDGKGDADY